MAASEGRKEGKEGKERKGKGRERKGREGKERKGKEGKERKEKEGRERKGKEGGVAPLLKSRDSYLAVGENHRISIPRYIYIYHIFFDLNPNFDA